MADIIWAGEGQCIRNVKLAVHTLSKDLPGKRSWAGQEAGEAFSKRGVWAGLGQQIGGGVHVENSKQGAWGSLIWETLQCLRRKDDRVVFNYPKDPCAKWALELRWGIITTA